MAQTKIRLLKEWGQGDVKYPVGQLLVVNDEGAEQLIGQKIAETYVPKADDVIKASPFDGGLGIDDIKAVIKESLEESSKKNMAGDKIEGDEYFKTGGYDEFWQFARDLFKAGPDRSGMTEKMATWNTRVKTAGYMEGGDMSQGGALVPVEFRNQILSKSLEDSIVRPRAMAIPMATSTVRIPYVKEVSRAASVYGGIIIYRPDEGGQITASNAKYGNVELNLHKLAGLVHVSTELLEDSPISMQPLLTQQFGSAIAWQEDEDFINGTGAGMSLGILNCPALIEVSGITDQDADTILVQNLGSMYSRMHSRGKKTAVWMANDDTFNQFLELALNVGTGGSVVGIIGTDITGAPVLSVLGRPLIFTEHCQTLGDKGDVIFADWSQYLVGSKAGSSAAKFASSIHLRFDYDETSFRYTVRVDGQPWDPSALTPKHSAVTQSSFVTMAARTGA
jgi:HK97 family phage major capsid protein